MGTFEKGYLGGFSGKVGTAVGSTWKKASMFCAARLQQEKGSANGSATATSGKVFTYHVVFATADGRIF